MGVSEGQFGKAPSLVHNPTSDYKMLGLRQ
jgi:hypothetical protein